MLLTTVVLLAPALLLIRRWTVPFGTFAVLFGAVAAMTAAIGSFDFGRAWAAVVPATMWLAYFGLLATFRTAGWSVELWAGVTVMSAITGFGLALCMSPPPVPPPLPPPVPAAG